MWDELRQRTLALKDKLGTSIDSGIVDTVTALRLIGVNTTASCWGHPDRQTGGPYVMFSHRASPSLERAYQAIGERSDTHYKELRHEAILLNISERLTLLARLERFYCSRTVALSDHLIICPVGAEGSRLQCQGAALIHVLDDEDRRELLRAHRAEFMAFTKFLCTQDQLR